MISISNRVYIQFTSFQDIDCKGNTINEPTIGYRIYDDYQQDYNNCYDSVGEMIADGLNRESVIAFVRDEYHDSFYISVEDNGVYLNDEFIESKK